MKLPKTMLDEHLYHRALKIVVEEKQASVSMLQRKLSCGFTAATQLISALEEKGVIGPYNGTRPREVYATTVPDAPETTEKPAKEKRTPTRRNPKPKKTDTGKPKKPGRNGGAGGAKSLYHTLEVAKQLDAVEGWVKQGATMEEVAEMLTINVSTIYEWKKRHPEFSEALRAGRKIADGELVAAAFKHSTGYRVPIKKHIKVKKHEWMKNPKTGEQELVQNEVLEEVTEYLYIPANANLVQFMLKNRIPEEYKDKVEHVVNAAEIPQFIDDIPRPITGKPDNNECNVTVTSQDDEFMGEGI